MALSKHMTRIVAIGTVKEFKADKEKPSSPGKGILNADGSNQVRFTIFNKTNGDNAHTKAFDFLDNFPENTKVYITGQDNRSYNADKDQYYENVNVWDFRIAEDEEKNRWVYVYVGDILEIDGDNLILGIKNYKDEVMNYPINISKSNVNSDDLEVGAMVKVKGTIFSGFKEDFFGDGEFVVERHAIEIKVLHSASEVAAENEDSDGVDESKLWS